MKKLFLVKDPAKLANCFNYCQKECSAEAMKEQQNTESISIQKEIFSWMLRRKMQGKMSQEIQEVVTTNAILKKVGCPENTLTTAQLCKVLGVDGILTSNFGLSKPTNEVHASLSISDYKNNKLIWNI